MSAGDQAVKRRNPLAEREAKDTVVAEEEAAGRTGGGTERAIVYDDDALDKLLDRSDLEKGLQQGERHSCGCDATSRLRGGNKGSIAVHGDIVAQAVALLACLLGRRGCCDNCVLCQWLRIHCSSALATGAYLCAQTASRPELPYNHSNAGDDGEVPESDFMKAFKVANFNIVEQPVQGTCGDMYLLDRRSPAMRALLPARGLWPW